MEVTELCCIGKVEEFCELDRLFCDLDCTLSPLAVCTFFVELVAFSIAKLL